MIYQLENKLQYSVDGNFKETCDIEFLPPSMNCFDQALELEQYVTRSFTEFSLRSDGGQGSSDGKNKGDSGDMIDVVEMAILSYCVDLPGFFNSFKKLCSKVAKLDEKQFLKVSLFNKIEYSDVKNMAFRYVANFLMPSILREGGKEK